MRLRCGGVEAEAALAVGLEGTHERVAKKQKVEAGARLPLPRPVTTALQYLTPQVFLRRIIYSLLFVDKERGEDQKDSASDRTVDLVWHPILKEYDRVQ